MRKNWWDFDNVDLPFWMNEDHDANLIVSFLNYFIPLEYSKGGTRYHILNRAYSEQLYFHLLNRPSNI